MRVPGLLATCVSVLLLTAWTTKAASSTPPRCTVGDTRRNATHFEAPYSRFCGPARGVVYLDGKTYTIRGGHCNPRQSPRKKRRLLTDITIGLIADEPAAPGRGIWLPHLQATRPGPVQIDDSEIEMADTRVAASGTVLIGTGLKSGSFFLYGRDASGPTGVTLVGTWTCG
jgi:hypothetical protein